MTRTSEYCALGHPDRASDFVVSYLLDRYMEKDVKSRVALECQIKDNHVTLGGEVTSAYKMTWLELCDHVRDAICAIGYTPEYAAKWGANNCIDPDALDIVAHIGQQSPDIAQGVNADGWGDQGIFWGMATGDETTGFMPLDYALAKKIGMDLYTKRFGGIDIKTQVTVQDGKPTECIVAIPILPTCVEAATGTVRNYVQSILGGECRVIVNGTGAYVRHASAGDCGTTGRKLAVDFYGGNCFIGGGAVFGKDPSKADVTLNVYARHLAMGMRKKVGAETVYCAINCCIGRREIGIVYFDGLLNEIGKDTQSLPASEIVAMMGLDRPVFAYKCRNGLFAAPPPEDA